VCFIKFENYFLLYPENNNPTMNQSEYEKQVREVQSENGGVGGETLGRMSVSEGVGKPISTHWCGEEEQKIFKIGNCHENIFHLNKKIKGQVMRGIRTIGENSDEAPHYWLFKNKMIWDISTFYFEEKKVRVWGYSLYKPRDFFRRYKITTAEVMEVGER
jgi:hypothetical protein